MLQRIKNTTFFIQNRLGLSSAGSKFPVVHDDYIECGGTPTPAIGLVLGSGLGALADEIDVISTLDYDQIPNFPRSTVEGHRGRFIYGMLRGKRVIAMQGRIHYYEGYTMEEVVLPIRAMCCLGIKTLIVSNAAGGLSPLFSVGDIMVIEDHINLLPNPLIGANLSELGDRFPDMSAPYDRDLIALLHNVASAQGVSTLRQGCYLASSGPTYETPAEYRYFQTIGADAAGMSTTPEVIVARHQGVRVMGLSLITNIGISNSLHKNSGASAAGVGSHTDVMNVAAKATETMSLLVANFVAAL